MIQPAQRKATYQDLIELPGNLVGEIIGGRSVPHRRPAPKHARASSILGVEVGGPFDKGSGGPGGWWIRTALGHMIESGQHPFGFW
jgi:hypothetical protein